MGLDIYYSSSPDLVPPTISSVGARRRGAQIDFKVGAEDASGIHRVLVAYTGGDGRWSSLDLTYTPATAKWEGSLTTMAELEWFVQVLDKAGNLSTTAGKSTYNIARAGVESVLLPLVLRASAR